jgi:hypothetical protein
MRGDEMRVRADPNKAAAREGVRQAISETLYKIATEHQDAPEGLELYVWHVVPYQHQPSEIVLRAAPDPVRAFRNAAEQPPDAEPDLPTVTLTPRLGGELWLIHMGYGLFPFWIGWDQDERIAVFSFGPG